MTQRVLLSVLGVLIWAGTVRAQSTTGTTTLYVAVGPEASLTVGNSTVLASTGNAFSKYTGATSLTYRVRTVVSGSITLQVTGDFSPQAGPSVANPPTVGDTLTYACAIAAPGTNGSVSNCTAATQAATGSATSVATFGADARSLSNGNTGTLNWALTNDPAYKSGSYSATVTFTISAS